jgi:O-antigen biosynthesis protein WbqP
MIRLFDVFLSIFGLTVLSPLMLILAILSALDTGSPLFCQVRIGQNQRHFLLWKFRSMPPETPSVATHLVNQVEISRFGTILRKFKLDELPQLWNVLRGDMSFVGPRPCLPSQSELIRERAARHVFDLRPGITGVGQVQGIDMSTPTLLAEIDATMINTLNLRLYFKYIFATLYKKM